MTEINIKTFCPKNKLEWREWLEKNHTFEKSVWLIYFKVSSGIPSLKHTDAIDQALCFGWIDAKGMSIDNHSYKVLFTRRKPKSVWSKINKEKVKKLIEQNLMTEAGYASIAIARQNGSWTILDEAEALLIPDDLQKEFEKYPTARLFFESLSRSDKRNILVWLVLAKRTETRQGRILEIVALAEQHRKPKQFH